MGYTNKEMIMHSMDIDQCIINYMSEAISVIFQEQEETLFINKTLYDMWEDAIEEMLHLTKYVLHKSERYDEIDYIVYKKINERW